MTQDKYLRRSHVSYSGRFILKIYLTLATVLFSVVIGIGLFTVPTLNIVNGHPFVVGAPGLDRSTTANVSHWRGWFDGGFLGFRRLVPVSGQPNPNAKATPDTSLSYHGSATPVSFCPVFDERDLIGRLARPCCEILFYTITGRTLKSGLNKDG
ncbi:hypothetical protein ES703_97225 [subsurface metagenome]